MKPIKQARYWMTTAPYTYEPLLQGNQQADIAIIGAGFTGLWTAVVLKELAPETDIAILEQGMAGFGASGRNAGMLDVTIDHSHALAIAHFGFTEAKKMADLGLQNVAEMTEFLKTNEIECDLEKNGRLFVALTPAHIKYAHKSLEIAAKLGINGSRWLNSQEIQDEVRSPLYLGGIDSPGAIILNPFQLVQGLKDFLLKKNVRFFERTSVTQIKDKIETKDGALSAKKVIVATDAFTHYLFPKLLARFIPLYDYILVSDPLTDEEHEAIGWKNRQGITDGRTFFNYYRLTKDNRILFGTSEAMYYSGNRVDS